MQTDNSNERIWFPNLDGWRFISFLSVFFSHTYFYTIANLLTNENPVFKPVFENIFGNGNFGVIFFFVISGYLITYLILSEIDKNGQVNIWKFYLRRFFRIWPLYFLVLGVIFLILPFIPGLYEFKIQENPLWYIFFLSNFDLINSLKKELLFNNSLAVTWSVAIEEQFYIVWPVLFYIVRRRLLYVFYLIVITSLIFRFFYYDQDHMYAFHTLSCMGHLALGGISAYYIRKNVIILKIFQNLKKSTIILIYCLGILLISIGSEFFIKSLLLSIVPLFFVFIIIEQNYSINSFFKISRFKTISKLGKYTYGLYLWHVIIISIVVFVFKKLYIFHYNITVLFIITILSLLISVLVAYLSYHFFELPFLKIKQKYFHY